MNRYDTYKDSGAEWLGDIPEHWDVKKVKYLAMLKSGESITAEQIEPEGLFQVFGGNGVRGYTHSYTHDGNYILIGRQGALCGNINYAENKFWASEHAIVVTPKEKVSLFWLGELFRAMNLNQYSQSAAQPGLAVGDLYNLAIPVPPHEEQIHLGSYVKKKAGEIDQIVQQKELLLQKLQAKRQAIVNEAVTRGINSKVILKPSGIGWLGDIPQHWEMKKLKHLITKAGSGVTPRGGAEVYVDKGIPLLRSQNIYNDGLRLTDVAYITETMHNDMNGSRVLEGDVLLNITGASIGRCYYYDGSLGEANVNQHVCIIRPIQDSIRTEYLHRVLCSVIGQVQIDILQTGANREGLNGIQLKSFVIPLPSIKEQEDILKQTDKKLSEIQKVENLLDAQIEKLKAYRQSLISEVVTGKIKVV